MFKLTPFSTSPRKRDDFVDFYNVIDDFFSDSPLRSLKHDSFKLDVEEKETLYVVHADLPGVRKEDIKVSYEDNNLTIAVEQLEEKSEEDKERRYLHRERKVSAMKRSIYLPDIEASQVKAKLTDGVLTIEAQKAEEKHHGHLIDVE